MPDIHCCAQHQEAKELANKLCHRYRAAGEKLFEAAIIKDFDARRFNACAEKTDKIEKELHNLMRGLAKCCSPYREPCWVGL